MMHHRDPIDSSPSSSHSGKEAKGCRSCRRTTLVCKKPACARGSACNPIKATGFKIGFSPVYR